MPRATKKPGSSRAARPPVVNDVAFALDWLERRGNKAGRESMVRFGVVSDRAFGVAMRDMQTLARRLGRNHDLAEALWHTGWYEARMVAAYIDEPERLTPAQMDRWCRDFDNWGICDTACFVLFDRTSHAWSKVTEWSDRRGEFAKRASFALLACLALHDKGAPDEPFLEGLRLIEQAASDDRNFVKKGVSWAIRLVGRRNAALNAASVTVARRLSTSENPSARWIGKGALKELTSAAVVSKLPGRPRTANRTAVARRKSPASKKAARK